MKQIKILCSRPGFRRAGWVHPKEQVYPAEALTDEQLEAFKKEPLLTVIEIEGEEGHSKDEFWKDEYPPADWKSVETDTSPKEILTDQDFTEGSDTRNTTPPETDPPADSKAEESANDAGRPASDPAKNDEPQNKSDDTPKDNSLQEANGKSESKPKGKPESKSK